MPRRRPGALRAARLPRAARWDLPPARIQGLSARTSLAIARVEGLPDDYHVYLGATDRALRRYRQFLQPEGRRPRYPQDAECACRGCSFDDVRHARDVLDETLARLPPRPRAELARLVADLDATYLRRTLPDPFAAEGQWQSDLWWRRRLAGGREEPLPDPREPLSRRRRR
ncbi:hypothetical protein OG866_10540 [Streptomyces sp. NBC_00663]|uniref:hypothetical protein n=1 Tax=Streptomyces sp. NBC_00663 TaxID=2975801 RepID=UPI002E3135F5|nr:hypothetical protein [Streptomyces sp. NBC_00663]